MGQKEASARYMATHRDALNERQRKRRQEDPVYREKQNDTIRKWKARKKEEGTYKSLVRGHHLKAKYGMSLEEYDKRLEAQGGGCAICKGVDPEGVALAVDHCHATDVNRGLLCGRCNKALGLFQDSPAVLAAAIQYLKG